MNLIILGPQGSGKGTQAKLLAQRFQLEHIDMGKALREVAKQDTPLGKEIYNVQNVTQTLVSDKVFRKALALKLGSLPREQGIIIDGAPRNLDQAEYVEELLQQFGRHIDGIIFVNISHEESARRVSQRWICDKCHATLIIGKDVSEKNKVCPKCSGSISQRSDDTPLGVKRRLEVFEKETMPVIEYFRNKNLVVEADGSQSIEKVFEDIFSQMPRKD